MFCAVGLTVTCQTHFQVFFSQPGRQWNSLTRKILPKAPENGMISPLFTATSFLEGDKNEVTTRMEALLLTWERC